MVELEVTVLNSNPCEGIPQSPLLPTGLLLGLNQWVWLPLLLWYAWSCYNHGQCHPNLLLFWLTLCLLHYSSSETSLSEPVNFSPCVGYQTAFCRLSSTHGNCSSWSISSGWRLWKSDISMIHCQICCFGKYKLQQSGETPRNLKSFTHIPEKTVLLHIPVDSQHPVRKFFPWSLYISQP